MWFYYGLELWCFLYLVVGATLSTKCQKIDMAKTESKWSEYLEECDEEEENKNINADGQSASGLKFQFSDVQVEEEVHPDFNR